MDRDIDVKWKVEARKSKMKSMLINGNLFKNYINPLPYNIQSQGLYYSFDSIKTSSICNEV